MKKGIKTVALILTLAMLISVLPVVPLAESVTPQINDLTTDEPPHIIKELTELRKQNEKHFELSDGTRMAAIYEDAVHYENENGAFEDIDNTLKNADTENYENTKAAIKATLSKKLKKDKTVQLCIGDQKLSWGFVNADQVNGKPEQQAESVQGDEAFLTLEKLTSRMIYENAFPGVDLEYIIHGSGIKENIILKTNNTQKEFYVEYKLLI